MVYYDKEGNQLQLGDKVESNHQKHGREIAIIALDPLTGKVHARRVAEERKGLMCHLPRMAENLSMEWVANHCVLQN